MKGINPEIKTSIGSLSSRFRFILVGFTLAWSALLTTAQAVTPPPDGGYPGFNTAEGQNALFSCTTGVRNTALGAFTLYRDTTGNGNTAVGINALRRNIIGGYNTAVGLNALFANDSTGSGLGSYNSAVGSYALFSDTDGWGNTAFGSDALYSNTTGDRNTAIGSEALVLNIGSANTGVGNGALNANVDGTQNTATGTQALADNSNGNFNTAFGCQALFANATGFANTALGTNALRVNISGGANAAVGYGALTNSTGGNNIALGANAGSNVTTASNVICIGTTGQNVNDSFYVGNVFETSIDADNLPVRIDFRGRLGTQTSSRRFKDHITPMDKASEVILALNPVTFHYKDDSRRRPEFGLIAEEVARVDPTLVALDKEGKPYTVRYDQVNAMLLNEFLKEHRKVEKLGATLEQQRNDFSAAIAELRKEMDAKIEEVSAQVQPNNAAPQMAVND
jgi:Chaperone of endosialidase